MKRRDVLKAGAAGAAVVGLGSAGSTGCVPITQTPADRARLDAAADRFLRTLDDQLAATDRSTPVTSFVDAMRPGPRPAAAHEAVAAHDALFKKTLRALFITQSFRDLPVETQLHPAVQERLHDHMEELDASVFELADFLSSQTAEQRGKLRDALRREPDAAMRIGEEMDRHAAAAGLSRQRRLQLRQMMSQAAFRMRSETPGALIDEYTAKVTRLRGPDGSGALALELSEKLGQRAFWRYQQHLALAQTSSAPGTASAAGSDPSSGAAAQPQPFGPRPTRGKGAVRAGAYMLGIGVVVFAGSLLLVNASEAFLVGMTVGALLAAIGFITLIIGALMYAAS